MENNNYNSNEYNQNENIEQVTNNQVVNEQLSQEQLREKKHNKYAFVVAIALVAVLIITGTFAWIRIGLNATKTNVIKAGALDLVVDESPTDGAEVRLENAIPQSYRQGLTNQPYKFTLINNSTIDTDYTITLEDYYVGADASLTDNDKIADNLIRYILVKNDDELVATNSKLLSTGRTIDAGTIAGKSGNVPTAIPYTLYIWIDSMAGEDGTEADIMSKVFNTRLGITAEQHHATENNNQGGNNEQPTTPTQTSFTPLYFAFGEPTTTDTTRPVNYYTYIGMDNSGNYGVCINKSGTEYCFKSNNAGYEKTHLQEVFAGITCTEELDPDNNNQPYGLSCDSGDYACAVMDSGDVNCMEAVSNAGGWCQLGSDNNISCF